MQVEARHFILEDKPTDMCVDIQVLRSLHLYKGLARRTAPPI